MSATVTYKGSTLTTVNNQTRTLATRGRWMEDNITITDVTQGGNVTITDEANATGITCVITTGQTPTPTPTPTPSGDIPLNTELIDFSKVLQGYVVEGTDGSAVANENGAMSDYTQIDPSMTFAYVGYQWWQLALYSSDKTFIRSIYMHDDADSIDENDNAHGTLTPSKMPSNAAYVRISAVVTYTYNNGLSLIRTA